MNLQNQKWLNALGLGSFGLFAIISVMLLAPAVSDDSHALSCGNEPCESGYTSSMARATLNAEVASVVSLGITPEVNFELVPKSNGEFQEVVSRLRVSTNNASGFSVYLRTSSDNNALVSTDKSNTAKISPVAANTFESGFTGNSWGYRISQASSGGSGTNGAYNPVPTTATSPMLNESTVNLATGNNYDLGFGISVDTTLPAGTYTGSVIVSAVANPITVTSLYQLTYMQDMTPDICTNTMDYVDVDNYATKQLIDSRDGKSYWVAKLADGNCWMVQNLALDLSTEKTLTSADTDLTSGVTYTPTSSTRINNLETTVDNQISPEFLGVTQTVATPTQYSWGIWQNTVLSTPLLARLCSSNRGTSKNNAAISTEQLYEICSGSGFVNTAGWSSTFTAQEGSIYLLPGNAGDRGEVEDVKSLDEALGISVESTTGGDRYKYNGWVAVNPQTQTYDPHYLVGNYYSWNAATAGTANSLTTGDANNSICPSGWKLPTSGSNSFETNGSFAYLFKHYGLATGYNTGQIELGEYNVAKAPFYFVRGGYISPNRGFSMYTGLSGNYGSRTGTYISNTPNDYYFAFDASRLLPSNGPDQRIYAYTLRCLAR